MVRPICVYTTVATLQPAEVRAPRPGTQAAAPSKDRVRQCVHPILPQAPTGEGKGAPKHLNR
jgi:hypothetical protein